MIFLLEKKDEDRKNLDESFKVYEQIVEKIGIYVLEAEEKAKEGCISPNELNKKTQYAKELLKRIEDLDDAAKQHNVMLEGDPRVLLTTHKSYLSKLENIKQNSANKSRSTSQ
jgi:predicted AlkP superfamily phosphohydrolase/phosphomutase